MSGGTLRPLAGRRIVVARPRAQAAPLAEALQALGAEVLACPMIRIADPADPGPLREAARQADGFDWIVFTSVNGVDRFWAELRAAGRDTRALCGVSLCAVGPATAASLELHGAQPDLVPDEYVAEAVVEALAAEGGLEGARILIPRPEVARSVVPDALRERGAEVVEVVAYRTVPDEEGLAEVGARLRAGEVDLLTFTASSAVHFFAERHGSEIGRAKVAAIGPVTAATARALGIPVDVQAEEYSVPGLVRAIEAFYRDRAEG